MRWLKKLVALGYAERSLKEELAEWRIFSLKNEVENSSAILRLRLVRPREANASFRTAIRIAWPYAGQMPSAETNTAQLTFERALDELSGHNNLAELVQVATGAGLKEWLFYSTDERQFMQEFERLLAGHDPYPIELSSIDDPEWEVWQQSLDAVRAKMAET